MDIDEEEVVDKSSESKDDKSNTPEVKELKVINYLFPLRNGFANMFASIGTMKISM